ncbi:MAG TPA: phospholipase D-like domain-containing protein [Mycobacterium sp.]|uniref:phospholipase D-like domain-containing protein n=1 Tax=Mycobacterium sp. TaxID=1785 RepID=UPI002F420B90
MTLSIADLDEFLLAAPPVGSLDMIRSFYAPIDKVPLVLQRVIGSALHSVVVSMFGYDDDKLAAMLDSALLNPNMHVQITLDSSQAGGVHEKAILEKFKHEMTGNSVAIGRSEKGAIVHRKMVIVDGLWWIGGSTNWSTSGETLQDNELTVVRDAMHCARARSVLDIAHDHILEVMAAKAA